MAHAKASKNWKKSWRFEEAKESSFPIDQLSLLSEEINRVHQRHLRVVDRCPQDVNTSDTFSLYAQHLNDYTGVDSRRLTSLKKVSQSVVSTIYFLESIVERDILKNRIKVLLSNLSSSAI